jgi:hypothetical protein
MITVKQQGDHFVHGTEYNPKTDCFERMQPRHEADNEEDD